MWTELGLNPGPFDLQVTTPTTERKLLGHEMKSLNTCSLLQIEVQASRQDVVQVESLVEEFET